MLTLLPILQLQSILHIDESLKLLIKSCHFPTYRAPVISHQESTKTQIASRRHRTRPCSLPLFQPHSCTPANRAFFLITQTSAQIPSALRKPCPDYLVTAHHITRTKLWLSAYIFLVIYLFDVCLLISLLVCSVIGYFS